MFVTLSRLAALFCYIVLGCAAPLQTYTKLAGDNQSIGTGRTFPARFQVTVTDGSGNPVPGSAVKFSAPASGASGGFTRPFITAATVNTDGNGVATSPAFIANSIAGQYTVSATGNLSFTVTNNSCVSNPTVTTNADAGAGSLRDAIANACIGSTITFSGAVVSPIKLNSRLRIDDNLTIQGPGSGALAIDGQSRTRLFFLGGGNISISGLTLQNGLGKGGDCAGGGGGAGMGGAIFANGGSLTATGVVFSGNSALGGSYNPSLKGGGGFGGNAPPGGSGASGGDLFGSGGFSSSTAGGNGGDGAGGGFSLTMGGTGGFGGGGGQGALGGPGGFGGGGGASVNGTQFGPGGFAAGKGTIAGGSGAGLGGAIFLRAGTLTLNACQFNNNSAQNGSSLHIGQGKGGALFILVGATAVLFSSTFSGNTATGAGQDSVGATYGIAPYENNTQCPGQDTANICGIVSVENATLLAGSNQTIGTGRTFPARLQIRVTDSGGNPLGGRPVTFMTPSSGASGAFAGGLSIVTVNTDGNGVATAPAFTANNIVGSYRMDVSDNVNLSFSLMNNACVTNPLVSNNADSGAGSLRDAIANACVGSTITFSGAVASPIKLNSRLRIDDNLAIQGPGSSTLAIDGQSGTRLFFLGGGNVSISGLTLQNGLGNGGDAHGGGGGAGMGGAIFINGGSLAASSVVFSNNTVRGGSSPDTIEGGGGGFGGSAPIFTRVGANGGDLFGSGGLSSNAVGGNGGDGAGGGFNLNSGGAGGFGGGGGEGSPGGRGGFGGGGGHGDDGAQAGMGGFAAGNGFSSGGGGAGIGGAIFLRAGALMVNACRFNDNSALGSPLGVGQGKGGALFILAGATAVAFSSSFSGNTADGAGQDSVGAPYGIAPYGNNTQCPGQDTADVCGILTLGVQVTVRTNIAGPLISVDGGAGFTGSQVFNWLSGNHIVSTSTPQTSGSTRYVWLNWSDNGAITHGVTGSTPTIIANFKTQYLLSTGVSPSALAGSISPASGFVDAGTSVSVSATANTGYVFTGFSGSLTGTTNPQNVTLSAPAAVTANFQLAAPMSLGGSMGLKSGPLNARVWTFTIGNNGPGVALAAQITSLTLQQTSGASCQPAILTPMPVIAGDIAARAAAIVSVKIDFTGCPANAFFKVSAPLSANNGAATGAIVRLNQLP